MASGQGRSPDIVLIDLVIGKGGQERSDNGQQDQSQQQAHTDRRGPIGQKAAARIVPQAAALDGGALHGLGALMGGGGQAEALAHDNLTRGSSMA